MSKNTLISAQLYLMVLDEANRMLDMGFEPEVRSILSQTCIYGAEPFPDIPDMVGRGPTQLLANGDGREQTWYSAKGVFMDALQTALEQVLGRYGYWCFFIEHIRYSYFTPKNVSPLILFSLLGSRGWKAVSRHGDKAQHAHTEAPSLFNEGSCPLMIPTDVAAQRLDIPDIEVVISYNFPLTTEDYVQRIGRTG
ncbi:DEAD-box ATP-dependent RNA helicase 5-like [Actinidia eriantha]|uniref:DEAD-box ATP-dependent RNA helicase 5-like n=1 Tax=Actinidia eriantha TaxID=165200 RepID=UPI00258B5EEF|nr:DEAD-box ATP-dependent RNA helicase 5-like [Actinidia eriantha]